MDLLLAVQWFLTSSLLIFFVAYILLVIGLGLFYYGYSNFTHFSRQDMPHERPLPFFGILGLGRIIKKSYPDLILDVYNRLKGRQYGYMYLFQQPVVVLMDPDLIGSVATKHFEYFTDRRPTFIDQEPVLKRGLPHLKGMEWFNTRSCLNDAFTSSKLKCMFGKVSHCCEQLVNFLEQSHVSHESWLTKENDTLVIEMKNLFTRYTNDVTASTIFDTQANSLKEPNNKFYQMGRQVISFDGASRYKWLGFVTAPKIMQDFRIKLIPEDVTEFFSSLTSKIIKSQTVFQQLMGIKRQNDLKGYGNRINDEDIIAQNLTFLLAEFDTSSTLLCFVFYELALHPDIQLRLQKEVDQIMKENVEQVTYEAVNNMTYLNMVVSETLRLHPPAVAIDRVCVKEYFMNAEPEIHLKPKDCVLIPIYGLHRDPDHFPNPDSFDPERFSDKNKKKIKPYTYLPFGLGPRVCIGAKFAMMEAKLAMVHLLSKFNVKVISKTPIPLKIIHNGFNQTADKGFWLGLEKRQT